MEVLNNFESRQSLWCLSVSEFSFIHRSKFNSLGNKPINNRRHKNRNSAEDATLKHHLASLGILLELFWPVNNEPPFGRLIKPGGTEFYKPMNWQHSTMYFFFLLYGSCRLLNARFMLLKGTFLLQY